MRAHCFQHVPFETPGSIESWLHSAGAQLTFTKFFEKPALPPLDAVDLLVVLGGPMSANDETVLPWLAEEKQWIRAAIERDQAVLGICLGAQLIANAMGARVYSNPEKEIGWFPVFGESGLPSLDAFALPAEFVAFHWHGETFDLPLNAVHLARSAACANQAFQLGRRVIGLQFHLETTGENAQAMVSHSASDLSPGRFVQTEEEILAGAAAHARAHGLMDQLLAFVTRR